MNNMEVFKELVKRDPNFLALPMEQLVPISFIGDAAVAAYRTIIGQLKRMDKLTEQNEKTLRDGQDAGKMQLLIQAAIGGKLREELPDHGGGGGRAGVPKVTTAMSEKQRRTARTIARHPEAIEEVIKEAQENEDIPTKTAVLNKIAYKEERAHKEEQRDKSKGEMGADTMSYLIHLDQAYGLIKDTPNQITEKGWQAIGKSLLNIKNLIEEMISEAQSVLQNDLQSLQGTRKSITD